MVLAFRDAVVRDEERGGFAPRVSIGWVSVEQFRVLAERLVEAALLPEQKRQPPLRLRPLRSQLHGLLKMNNGVVGLQLGLPHATQFQVGQGVGLDLKGGGELPRSFIEPASFAQRHTQIVVAHEIVPGHRQRVLPEREAVAPVAELQARADNAQGQNGPGENRAGPASERRNQFGPGPRHHDEQADDRDVGKAVGHGLHPGLHQADGGHEQAEKPKPADEQIGPAVPVPDGHAGDREQHQTAAHDRPPRPFSGMRIEHRQVVRPKCFPEVACIGNNGVLHAQSQ